MVEHMPDVSIVVTVHNSEKYLEECLDSACGQTYQNIEIICVDGGSRDRSPDILKRYRDKDKRIKIINDANTSYGHKLNIGFEAAEGKYVGILESDDKLCLDMVENLYGIASRYGTDVAGGNVSRMFNYKGQQVEYGVKTYQDTSYYGRLIEKEKEPIQYAHGAVFASLYKKSFLMEKNIKVNETPGASFQDQGLSFLTDILAERAYYIDLPVYRYRVDNPGSSVYDDKKIFEIFWEMQFIETELKKRDIIRTDIWEEFWSLKYECYIGKMFTFSQEGRELFKNEFEKELRNDMRYGVLDKHMLDERKKAILHAFLDDNDYFDKNDTSVGQRMERAICAVLDQVIGRPAVIFGAGQRGRHLCSAIESICKNPEIGFADIKCICDNSVSLGGYSIMGKRILPVRQAVEEFPEAVYIVSSIQHGEDMASQLKEYGIKSGNIAFFK